MTLPFLDTDDDLYNNLCTVLIIISTLGKTSRGTLKLNNGKLHIFLYLVKNPVALNDVLGMLGKGAALLSDVDTFSVTSISPNIDPLFDRVSLKSLLSILIAKQLVTVSYKKNDGFFYVLSESGKNATSELRYNYLKEISLLCDKLKGILGTSDSLLNRTMSKTLRMESL